MRITTLLLAALLATACAPVETRHGDPGHRRIYEVSKHEVRGCRQVTVLIGERTEMIEKARVRGATHVVWATVDPNNPNSQVTGTGYVCD